MKYLLLATLALACSSSFSAIDSTSKPFTFNQAQLEGSWADSVSTEAACSAQNTRFSYTFSADLSRVTVKFDRAIDSGIKGKISEVDAEIISSTARTLVIRYQGESRLSAIGKPIEWELAIVAPGIYRWRATDWQQGEVNTVVGIRCAEK
jgi:hypothetical protein